MDPFSLDPLPPLSLSPFNVYKANQVRRVVILLVVSLSERSCCRHEAWLVVFFPDYSLSGLCYSLVSFFLCYINMEHHIFLFGRPKISKLWEVSPRVRNLRAGLQA